MVKQPPKMTALVVSAIRNLREVKGSTPREILNYISSEYNASNASSDGAIQRKLCTALKRGLEYGILKQDHGHYCLNTDPETIAPMDNMIPMDRASRGCKGAMRRKRKRRARTGGRKGCKSRSRRRRKASGRKRRRGGKRSKCGSRKRKSRARSRKAKKCRGSKRRPKRSARRSRRAKSKCGQRRMGEEIDMLAKDPVDTRHRENAGVDYTYEQRERSHSRPRHQSRSRSHSRSHSRSSGSSERDGNERTRRSRQVE